jgi:predicted AAA+ superfamily ATPase
VSPNPKIYFRDPGLRNALSGGFSGLDERGDRGPLFESWVAGELAKRVFELNPNERLSYWRSKSKAEVDFVLEKKGRLVGVEVKASALKRPMLSRSSRSFIEAYAPGDFIVVNLGLTAMDRIGDTDIRWEGPELFARLEGRPPVLPMSSF